MQLKVKHYSGGSTGTLQALTFGAAYVTRLGTYTFPLNGLNGIFYTDTGNIAPCDQYGSTKTTTYQAGTLIITRFDLAQGVIAGTFSFKLYQPGCDTLRLTQGRFDYKL